MRSTIFWTGADAASVSVQICVDGVDAAVVMLTRASARRVREPQQCRDGVVPSAQGQARVQHLPEQGE